MDHNENFVDLADPFEPWTPKDEEDDWSFDYFADGDDADNLDYNAFRGRR
jgi:hypothetical protein